MAQIDVTPIIVPVVAAANLGPPGAPGPEGPRGPTGPSGGTLYWSGNWGNNSFYAVNDAVTYQGSSYVCTVPTTDQDPPPPSFMSHWRLLAAAGAPGADGTGFVYVGTWNSGTTYGATSVVDHNGALYSTMAEEVPVGTEPGTDEGAYWTMMLPPAPPGPQGPPGADGADGATGPAGGSYQKRVEGAAEWYAYPHGIPSDINAPVTVAAQSQHMHFIDIPFACQFIGVGIVVLTPNGSVSLKFSAYEDYQGRPGDILQTTPGYNSPSGSKVENYFNEAVHVPDEGARYWLSLWNAAGEGNDFGSARLGDSAGIPLPSVPAGWPGSQTGGVGFVRGGVNSLDSWRGFDPYSSAGGAKTGANVARMWVRLQAP